MAVPGSLNLMDTGSLLPEEECDTPVLQTRLICLRSPQRQTRVPLSRRLGNCRSISRATDMPDSRGRRRHGPAWRVAYWDGVALLSCVPGRQGMRKRKHNGCYSEGMSVVRHRGARRTTIFIKCEHTPQSRGSSWLLVTLFWQGVERVK